MNDYKMKDFSTLSTKYFKLQNRVYFPKSNIHIYMYKVIITASRASKLTQTIHLLPDVKSISRHCISRINQRTNEA